MTEADRPDRRGSRQFLTFSLGREEYGLEILKVREIIGMLPITRVPNSRPSLRGLVNLRGKVLAVIDTRLRLGMEYRKATDDSCIICVRGDGLEMGLLVDSVSEVIEIADRDVEQDQTFSSRFLMGIGKVGGKVKLLIDLDRLCRLVAPEAEAGSTRAALSPRSAKG